MARNDIYVMRDPDPSKSFGAAGPTWIWILLGVAAVVVVAIILMTTFGGKDKDDKMAAQDMPIKTQTPPVSPKPIVAVSPSTTIGETQPSDEKATDGKKPDVPQLTKKPSVSKTTSIVIHFGLDSSVVPYQDKKKILTFINGIASGKGQFTIKGYTCDIGPDTYNLDLSKRRATAVKKIVQASVEKKGYSVQIDAFGEQNPKLPNVNSTNRSKNRRVELSVQSSN